MSNTKKLAFLRKLVEIENDSTLPLICQEIKRIRKKLFTSQTYEGLDQAIDELNAIAFKVPDVSLPTYNAALEKITRIKQLDYESTENQKSKMYAEFYSKERLLIKLLEGITSLRYCLDAKPNSISLLFNYINHPDETVKSQAIAGIKSAVSYKIFVLKKIGLAPQELVLDILEGLSADERVKYFPVITMVCGQILSPTMEESESDYKTVTFSTAEVYPCPELASIRKRALALLKDVYPLEGLSIDHKKEILGTFNQAKQLHHGVSTDAFLAIVVNDTIEILNFLEELVLNGTEENAILQKIEHDLFWTKRHRAENDLSDEIGRKTQEIRKILLSNPEYAIFRILIGFESIFEEEFPTTKSGKSDYNKEREWRENKARGLAEQITPENSSEWFERIRRYSSIKSNDMMMFPTFGVFLEHFGQHSPTLAKELLLSEPLQIDPSLTPPVFNGLLKSASPETFSEVTQTYLSQNKALSSIAFIMMRNKDAAQIDLAANILQTAQDSKDVWALTRLIHASAHYPEKDGGVWISKIFIPALSTLTELNSHAWVYDFWLRTEEAEALVNQFTKEDVQIVLANLLNIEKIDYHQEDFLAAIAQKYPEEILNYFGDRLAKVNEDISTFDAVPFDLHELSEALSQYPEICVHIIHSWIGRKRGLYKYDGPRLLKVIFPNFPKSLEAELLKLIQTGEKETLLFVANVLRNYTGEIVLHKTCKELIKAAPEERDILNLVRIALDSTGVVSGEYGLAEAYKERQALMAIWLEDKSDIIRNFAHEHIQGLEKQEQFERERGENNLALMKYKYGEHLTNKEPGDNNEE